MSTSWDDLPYKIQPWIRDALISEGYTEMTPVQASTIPLLSQNKDVVVEAVTGSGKTLSYVIPVLEKVIKALDERTKKRGRIGFNGLIVAPTRELAAQITDVINKILEYQPEELNISAQRLVGSLQPIQEDVQWYEENRPQILVGTPGRLKEFLAGTSVSTSSCAILVLDEADKLLDANFLRPVQSIAQMLPKQRRTGLFSATISSAGNDVFKVGMTNPVKVTVKSTSLPRNGTVPTSLDIYYMLVPIEQKFKILWELLNNYNYRKAIVYLPSSNSVSAVYSLFESLKHPALFSIHGKLETKVRLRALNKFADSDAEKAVMFTTDVAARGLDIPKVDLVIQVDPPTDPEMFLHRCGRTGRANHHGRAIMMLTEGREEEYIGFMDVKGITLQEQKAPPLTYDGYDEAVHQWMLQDRAHYDLAVRAFVSYVQYYSKHVASSIFRVRELDFKGLARLHGLTRLPKMPENRFVKDFPEGGYLDHSIDFDTYAYKDPKREAARLHELKTGERKKARHEKAMLKRGLNAKNTAWSHKMDTKETKVERRAKAKHRRDAVEEQLRKDEPSSDSEAEADWKDAVLEKKRKKNSGISMFEGL